MTLIEATKSCLVNYAKFSGRSARSEFWKFMLFLLLSYIALTIINSVIFGPTVTQGLSISVDSSGDQRTALSSKTLYNSGWLGTIFMVATLLPTFAVTWRRMHDTGHPGWYSLLPVAVFAIGFGLIFVTSSPVPIDTRMMPEGVTMPDSIRMPRWPILALSVWLACVGSIILVIYWLARRPEPNTNQFGPVPD